MEVDIINDIVFKTVEQLFKPALKYSATAVPLSATNNQRRGEYHLTSSFKTQNGAPFKNDRQEILGDTSLQLI